MSNVLLDSKYHQSWLETPSLTNQLKGKYASYLRRFGEYIELRGITQDLDFNNFYHYSIGDEYSPIDVAFLDEYIAYLEDGGATPSVLRTSIAAVRRFFKHLKGVQLIARDPYAHYPNPFSNTSKQKRDRALSLVDTLKLLKCAEREDPFLKVPFLIVWVMVVCGLRASEVCELRPSQINLERQTIVINHGQKTSACAVHVPRKLATELTRYLEHPAREEVTKDQPLFQLDGKPLSYAKLAKLISDLSKKAGIQRHVTPHDLRYTTACAMLQLGFPLTVIQRQMRHKFLATTLHYLPIGSGLQAAVNRNQRCLRL